jgi:hypothetical protein
MPVQLGHSQRLFLLLVLFAIASAACRTSSTPTNNELTNSNIAPDKIKLQIKEDGVYRLTEQDLTAAGIGVDVFKINNLRLSQDGQIVPAIIADNSLIFYGYAPESRYVTERPYILETGKTGLEMPEVFLNEFDGPVISSVSQTLHLEENHEYAGEARREDNDDVWFWYKLRQQDVFQVEVNLSAVENSPATVRVNAWGFTFDREIDGDHSFDLSINDIPVGSVVWDGQTFNTSETEIPGGILRLGSNKLTIDNRPEGASFLDIMLINWIELTYLAPAEAVNDRLNFPANRGVVQLDNFSSKPIILNITNRLTLEQIINWRYEEDKVYLPIAEEMDIIALGPDGFLAPKIEPMRASGWHDENLQADLIIVTTDELAPSLAPLVQAREKQGLKVALVPVEEIYDEFGYGEASPESVRRFVTYAYENWREPKPRYLFLVGDATTDFHGNLGDLPPNTVPSLIVPVQFSGETVSDSRLVDIDGDMRPEMAVGRWPSRTTKEVESLVERTLAYEKGQASNRAIFATDGSEARFSDIAENLTRSSDLLEGQYTILNGSPASEIASEWNNGSWLTTYIGHGSISRWGKDGKFELDSVEKLTIETPPIVLQLTCLTGLFSHPEQISLSEAMLAHPNGPVLTVAATSLTLSGHQEPFAMELLQQLQNPNIVRIGDAFQEAKLSLEIENSNGLREISDTFALLGDPSTIIVRP